MQGDAYEGSTMGAFVKSTPIIIMIALFNSPVVAQFDQRTCWHQVSFSAKDVFEIKAVPGGVAKLTVSFDADTSANVIEPKLPEHKAYKLAENSIALVEVANYISLQDVDSGSFYNIPHRLKITISRDTIIYNDNYTSGHIPGKTPSEVQLSPDDPLRVQLAPDAKLTPAAEFAGDLLVPHLLPSATPFGTIKAMAIKPGVDFAARKEGLVACMLLNQQWIPVSIEKNDAKIDTADLTVMLPTQFFGWYANPTLAVRSDDGIYFGAGKFYTVPGWIGAVSAILCLAFGHVII